ncbi:MAG: DEAD/DEAH box helicase, partial [Propionicimonas sp.]
RLADRLARLQQAARQPAGDPWPGFERRASDYYALLSEFVATGVPSDAIRGFLTDDVVADVEAQPLDGRLRDVDLRGYQSFGARFALARRRVILGDEMGLGKTIQALAATCHLRTFDSGPVLVVCPASVMANWEREVEHRTHLPALTLHGPDRQDEVAQWLTEGPIGITTYDTLRRLELPHDLRLAALIVDEAHFVKNPGTARSRVVRRLAGLADHVWFLTGTPMENTAGEFAELIRYLQSDLVPPDGMPSGSVAFRRRVSPVYLRRNALDVLVELPSRQEIDEWVYLTAVDEVRYAAAVRSGNLMEIRRAGFGAPSCAKLDRLGELLAEAAANGLKVVVYSFFLDVLGWAETVAGAPAFGPLTGAVPATERQRVVDAFTAHAGPAVLFAQIQAGGIGLNLQAASVVVLCEPQLTPTSEEQAIARAHRMGQVRPVQVHRLLAVGTVDERITELLSAKRADFDAYARRSELAEAARAAVDVTFGDLGKRLVAEEQSHRLR